MPGEMRIESREHDAAGNILVRSVTTYDDHDQVIGHISYRADGSVIRRKSYEYQYDLKQNWIKKDRIPGFLTAFSQPEGDRV
jgi:hypothetical protein